MTNKKIYIFQLFFPLGSGPTKGMSPVNVFSSFFFHSVLRAASVWMDLASCASIWVISVDPIDYYDHIT